MKVIEREANIFLYDLDGGTRTIEIADSLIGTKLHYIRRDKDKLSFLKILMSEILTRKETHEKTCVSEQCGISNGYENAIFVLGQYLEDIETIVEDIPNEGDIFNYEERSQIYKSIDEILKRFDKLDAGHEVIFDEIDDLKEHLNLGKKKFFQLAKGKLLDLVVSKLADTKTANEIFSSLSKEVHTTVQQFLM